MIHRIWRLEAGEVENAEIDGGNHHMRGLAGFHPGHFQRHRHFRARVRGLGHLEHRLQGPVARVDPRIGEAHRTHRHTVACGAIARDLIGGADHRGGDIGPRAPFLAHRQVDDILALGHRHRFQRNQSVGQHRDQGHAICLGHDPQMRHIARPVARLIEREREAVRAFQRTRRGIPARLELHRGGGKAGALHHQLILPPIGAGGDLCRSRAQGRIALGHAAAAGHRFPIPRTVERIPLIAGLDLVDHPMHLHRRGLRIGANRLQLEPGIAVLRQRIIGKERPDADHRRRGQHHPAFAPLDRTARAFADAQGEIGHQRARGLLREIGARRVNLGMARGIGHLGAEAVVIGGVILVIAAKAIARIAGQRAGRAQPQIALHPEIGPRRAKEIARIESNAGQIVERQRPLGDLQREINPLGQEILDQQPLRGERRRFRIGIDIEPPGAARHAAREGEGHGGPACALILGQGAGIFHPIRTHQNGGQRHTGQRLCRAVTRQKRRMDHLARAIGTAVGRGKDIDRRGGGAPLDPAVRQVEFRVGQREEGHVLLCPGAKGGGDQRGGGAILAPGQPGVEMCDAVSVGLCARQHRVGTADQRHCHTRACGHIREAAHRDGQAIGAPIGAQAEIRDGKPLQCRGNIIGILAGNRRLQHIDARPQGARHILHRQAGGHVTVDGANDIGGAAPDHLCQIVGQILRGPGIQRAGKVILLEAFHQIAVRDPQEAQIEMFGIHRLDGQARILGAGQDIGPARKAHGGAAVTDIGRDIGVFRQRLALG